MQMPNVRTTIEDQNLKITFHVMAYRTLSRDEMILAVRHCMSQKKRKRPKPGQEITIISTIGANG